MNLKIILLIVSFHFITIGFSQNGKLDNAKKKLNQKTELTSTSITNSTTKNKSKKGKVRNYDNPLVDILYKMTLGLVYGIAIESNYEKNTKMHNAKISHYPYKDLSNIGNYTYTDSTNYALARLDISNNFILESKNLFGNDLVINYKYNRFDFAVNYSELLEKVENKTTNFSLISAMVNYHRIRSQKLDIWFGLGISHVANNVNKSGFTFGVGGEWFVKKPLSLLVSSKFSSINSESINSTKILLKYHIKKYYISSGYQNYNLANSTINAYSLGFGISF